MSGLLDALGIDLVHLPAALSAMEKDSQEGVVKNSLPFRTTDKLGGMIDK